MATPTIMSGPSRSGSVSKGERFNKRPILIVGAIFALFGYGLYYAAQTRVKPQRTYNSVAQNLETSGANQEYQSIDFLRGREDGLVNAIAQPDIGAAEANTDENESDLASRLARMIEEQRLGELDRSNKIEAQLVQRQYELAQQALEGDMSIAAFDRMSGYRPEPFSGIEAGSDTSTSAQTMAAEGRGIAQAGTGSQQNVSTGASQNDRLAAGVGQSSTDASGVIENRDFVSRDYRNDFTLYEGVTKPSSKFQLMTGTLIPGVMISAANSELPGDLIAQVTQDVYDSVTGRYLLIPQGSKLFGRYDSFAALGSERLLMVWDRLVLPDGEALTLGSIQGYDDRGLSGAKDIVITRFWKTLFNAFLLSVATSSADALVDESAKGESIVGDITANFGTTTSSAFDDYLRQRLRIKPTFEIRSGYRFNIVVNRDITFPEPFEFGYTRLEMRN